MKVQLKDDTDPKGYRTMEEVEAEWKAERELEKWRRDGSFGLLWKSFYLLRECYYAVFYRFDPKYELKRIYWFFQRGWRGWSDRDTWDFHYYLSKVIKGGVKRLRDNKHGIPTEFWLEGRRSEKLAEKLWNAVLDEIIWAFDMSEKISDGEVHPYIVEWSKKKNRDFANKLGLMAVSRGDKPDHYMTKEEQDRMEAGLLLFTKHFWSLWD